MRVRFKNRIRFRLFDADGRLADAWEVKNFLTDLGEAHIADRLSDAGTSAMSHMGVGTGGGQSRTSVTLANEIARVALDATYPLQGSGGDDNDVLYKGTFAAGTGTGTLTEFAIFNAASGGTMLNYASGFSKVKAASQSLEITMTMTIGES